ncbi:MAG TPA: glutaredoxin family protein [Anaerolineae bacterium]|nr:glutaredoxin family protein [Anaerolineae bacterium]HQK15794.1 glutaredoxin family protein [Anaerolineae bacterium]
MAEPRGSVAGIHQEHQVKFYGLSTCIWCRKTRQFLEDEKVAFDFVYVDLLQGDEREAVKDEIQKWNPHLSFPTIVIDEATCVVGFKTDELKEALGL